MIEFRVAKGWAIFIYLTAPFLIILFGWLLLMPFLPNNDENISPGLFWFFTPLSIGMIGLMIVGLLDTAKGKVVIEKDKIYSKSTFSYRQLMLFEIRGYRIDKNYISIEPIIEGKKRIKISTYFGKTDELIEWLDGQYPDLDLLNAEQEEKEILNDQSLGETPEQRKESLLKARKTAKILNWTGGLVGAWTWFWANPYEYAIIASIAVPIISVIALKVSGGLIRLDERKDTAYPTITWAFLAPSLALCLRALVDFNIFNFDKVWVLSSIITAIAIGVLSVGNKEFKFNKTKDLIAFIGVSLISFAYGFGTVITLNCFYDKSEAQLFNPKVLDKRVSSGKSTTYYLELSPWGLQKEIEEVSVPKELYEQLNKDEIVSLYFRKGFFEIPWFIVTK